MFPRYRPGEKFFFDHPAAKKNNELIFLEVKTRTSSLLAEENLISISQQKRIINAADHFIKQNELDYNIRFDMIFVEISLNSFKFFNSGLF